MDTKQQSKTALEQRTLRDEEKCLAANIGSCRKHELINDKEFFKNFPLEEIMQSGYGDKAPNRRREVAHAIVPGVSIEVFAGEPGLDMMLLRGWYKTEEPNIDKPKQAFDAIGTEDMVRFLDQKKLAQYLKDARTTAGNKQNARDNAADMLDALIEHKIVKHFEIYKQIGFLELVAIDPKVLVMAIEAVSLEMEGQEPFKKGARPGVQSFYAKLDSKALATLDLKIVEKVFATLFELKYKLIEEPKPQPPLEEPKVETPSAAATTDEVISIDPNEDSNTNRPTEGTAAARQPFSVARPAALPSLDNLGGLGTKTGEVGDNEGPEIQEEDTKERIEDSGLNLLPTRPGTVPPPISASPLPPGTPPHRRNRT